MAAPKLIELILQNRMSPYRYTPDAKLVLKSSYGIDVTKKKAQMNLSVKTVYKDPCCKVTTVKLK